MERDWQKKMGFNNQIKENEEHKGKMDAFELFQEEIKKKKFQNKERIEEVKQASRSFILNKISQEDFFDFKFQEDVIKEEEESSAQQNIQIWKTLEKFNEAPLNFSLFLNENKKNLDEFMKQEIEKEEQEIQQEQQQEKMEIQVPFDKINQTKKVQQNQKKQKQKKNQKNKKKQVKLKHLKKKSQINHPKNTYMQTKAQNVPKFVSLSEVQIFQQTRNDRYPARARIPALRYWCEKKVYNHGELIGILTKYY